MKGTLYFRKTDWIGGSYVRLIRIDNSIPKEDVINDIGLWLQEYLVISGDIFSDGTEKKLSILRNEISERGYEIVVE